MMIPPEGYRVKGYKVWTVGDDIAWMRQGEDGRLYAINPENGFFGVAPGTTKSPTPTHWLRPVRAPSSPMWPRTWTTTPVWWESLDKNPPEHALDWTGEPWNGKTSDKKGAHPNSRFTAPAKNCPCISPEFDKGAGVPISAIIFGGRRASTTPLVYQSRDWNHGVFVGSIMASETTAAATGAVGVLRHDPSGHEALLRLQHGDYFQHWIDMGKKLATKLRRSQCQLVPCGRKRPLHMAGLRRQPARCGMDH